ncbi:hypothetical protein ASPSYDRAFT_50536 [Aspergillus sydowii CBS 593.65]|uniref:Uncharacterized protein n=1 Tax=Aspergillus sydowii CBS 593.65 TaxID=1036612 RepID=A0A1L9T365_9EURO|nr:uncharacterized protein ASPSYDRAFT_50536 [Aspergillus sydowii CBS 593.65]OJJ53781.1 hypothetical protein ASPSYDRAFT_50536 [Aspergillus sydowii CBS 593.65]
MPDIRGIQILPGVVFVSCFGANLLLRLFNVLLNDHSRSLIVIENQICALICSMGCSCLSSVKYKQ